jgi:hypothetical protein
MKENDKLTELTLEKLQTNQKWLKATVVVSSIMTLFLIGAFIYSVIKSKNYSYYIPLGILLANILFSSLYLKKLGKEIKSRNL